MLNKSIIKCHLVNLRDFSIVMFFLLLVMIACSGCYTPRYEHLRINDAARVEQDQIGMHPEEWPWYDPFCWTAAGKAAKKHDQEIEQAILQGRANKLTVTNETGIKR